MKIQPDSPWPALFMAGTILGASGARGDSDPLVIEWDPVDDSRVSVYEIYYGTQLDSYKTPPYEYQPIEVPQTSGTADHPLSYSFSDLDPYRVYYFSIRATDGSSKKSDFSNEITSGRFRYLLSSKADDGSAAWIEVENQNQEFEQTLETDSWTSALKDTDARIATGDIDGDGRDEVVIGHAARDGAPPLDGLFQILDDDFSSLTWGKVSWHEYNAMSGETYPAIGDIDGDGLGEIVIGLGSGGAGMIEIFSYKNGALTSVGWTAVDWPDYFEAGGKSLPALGDIDGNGHEDLVIGFSAIAGNPDMPGGVFVVQTGLTLEQEASSTLASTPKEADASLIQVGETILGDLTWSSYASRIGETRPALGDLDGDGRDEVVIGLGENGDGLVEIFDYQDGRLVSKGLAGVTGDYSAASGETRPAVGDIDQDGKGEILIGLGDGSFGTLELLDDADEAFVSLDRFQGSTYSADHEDAGFWPAIKQERK